MILASLAKIKSRGERFNLALSAIALQAIPIYVPSLGPEPRTYH